MLMPLISTCSQVWVKEDAQHDKGRVFKIHRIGEGVWSVSYGSGNFPLGFTNQWGVTELSRNTKRFVHKGDYTGIEIEGIHDLWKKRIEKEGFTFKGVAQY